MDGTRARPTGDEANATVKAWVKDKAMSLLASSLEREQLKGLTTCMTANVIWIILTGIYKQQSASSKLLLLQRYHEYRMKSGDSVIQHVTNVQRLASHLKDAGQELTKVDIMAKVLGLLLPSYSTLATAWDSVPVAEQNVGVLLERLIKEESRMTEEDSATSALAALRVSEEKPVAHDLKRTEEAKRKVIAVQNHLWSAFIAKRKDIPRATVIRRKGTNGLNPEGETVRTVLSL